LNKSRRWRSALRSSDHGVGQDREERDDPRAQISSAAKVLST
jgi:hypothetical protein